MSTDTHAGRGATFLLLLLSGVVYPLVAYYVSEKLIHEGFHQDRTNGADVPAIVVLLTLPITCSIATAALARRRWRACLGYGILSAVGVVAVVIAVIAALAHSGVLE